MICRSSDKQIKKRITVSRQTAARVIQAANPDLIVRGNLIKQRVMLEGTSAARQ